MLKDELTILICSAAARVSLLECFRAAGQVLGLRLRVLATDPEPELSAACQRADASFAIADGSEPGFVAALLKLCRREQVALVLPTIEPDLLPLSEARGDFAAIGTDVVVSAPSVVRIAGDKLETARVLGAAGVPVPHTVSLGEFMDEPERLTWPVIAKPFAGTSSVGLIKPRRREDLARIIDEGYVVQERWEGREYTINVFFDREGRLRSVVPHWRMRVRNGVVEKAQTKRLPVLQAAAEKLAQALPGTRGPLCFQAIVNDAGAAAVFEVNARLGGGCEVACRAGADFPRWLLEEASGREATAGNEWREDVTMLRYDAAVFR